MASINPLYITGGAVTKAASSDDIIAQGIDAASGILSLGTSGAASVAIGTGNLSIAGSTIGLSSSGTITIGDATNTTAVTIGGAATDTVTIGASASNVDIGQAANTITIKGNLAVDGTETVTNSTTLNGDVQLGSDNVDAISFLGEVDTDIVFNDGTPPYTISAGDGQVQLVGDASNPVAFKSSTGIATTGTITVTTDTAVSGSTTAFTTELRVGDAITTAGGQTRIIASITNDTTAAVTQAWSSGEAGVAYTIDGDIAEFLDSSGTAKLTVEHDGSLLLSQENVDARIFVTTGDPATTLGSSITPASGDIALSTNGSFYWYSGSAWTAAGAANPTLQSAYVNGNTITTSGGEGSVIIAGTEQLQITATNGLNVDTQFDFDGTVFDVQMTGGNAFSIDGGAASNVTVDSANLTLSTSAAGSVLVDGADGVELNSSGGALQIGNDADAQAINVGTGAAARTITVGNATGATSVNLDSGSGGVNLDATGGAVALTTTTSGNITMAPASGNDVVVTTAGAGGAVTVNAGGDGGVDINATAGGITLDAVGTSNFSVAGDNLTLETTTSGTLAVTAADTLDLNAGGAGGVTVDATAGGVSIDAAGASNFTTSSGAIDIDAVGAVSINSSAGALNLGDDAVAQAINIGTGAAARTITIGNITGATALDLNSGTGGVTIDSTGTGDIVLTSADTLLLDSAGILEINSSAGAISIGNDAVAQAINVGTGAAARTITVGNTTTTTAVDITSGATGDITFEARGSGANSLTYNDATNQDITGGTFIGSETSIVSALLALDTAVSGAGDTILDLAPDAAITQYSGVYLTATGRVAMTNAGAAGTAKFIGIALDTATAQDTPATIRVQLAGEAQGTGTLTSVGSYVYVSATNGQLTTTAPSSPGDTVLKAGVISASGKVIIQVGTAISL